MEALLLTQNNCELCDRAKEILDRLAGEFSLSVSTINLHSAEGQHLAMRTQVMFPPGLLLDGELFGYGRLSERRLRRELQRRLAS